MTAEDKKIVCSIFFDLQRAYQEILSIEEEVERFDWHTQQDYHKLVGKMFDFPNFDYQEKLKIIDCTDEDDEQYNIFCLLDMIDDICKCAACIRYLCNEVVKMISTPHEGYQAEHTICACLSLITYSLGHQVGVMRREFEEIIISWDEETSDEE